MENVAGEQGLVFLANTASIFQTLTAALPTPYATLNR